MAEPCKWCGEFLGHKATCAQQLGLTEAAKRISELTDQLAAANAACEEHVRARVKAEGERDEWKIEATALREKCESVMNLKHTITDLNHRLKRSREVLEHERRGFTRRRKDKAQQWQDLESQRDSARTQLAAANERADKAEAGERQARQALSNADLKPGWDAVYRWLDENKDKVIKDLSDHIGALERQLDLEKRAREATAQRVTDLELQVKRQEGIADDAVTAHRRRIDAQKERDELRERLATATKLVRDTIAGYPPRARLNDVALLSLANLEEIDRALTPSCTNATGCLDEREGNRTAACAYTCNREH